MRPANAMHLLVLGVLLGGGCSRDKQAVAEIPPPVVAEVPSVAPTADRPPTAKGLKRYTSSGRVVAMGDVHGDLAATRAALRLAGAIDTDDRWIGGNLFVVQTGDHLDRGDDEPEIALLFKRLEEEARAAGGAFIALCGNHELMNVGGDFRYVTPDGLADFGGKEGRLRAFGPGGEAAKRLAELSLYAIVDDTIFTHAGVSPADLDVGLDVLDSEARAWLLGTSSDVPRALTSPESVLWTRRYGRAPTAEDCAAASDVLKTLGLKRMVVGHSPQAHINAVCDGAVWRIDVGLAKHYGGPTEVLVIERGEARALGMESGRRAAE